MPLATLADVALVREAGGLGDVIRIGSVARALKRRGVPRVTVYGLNQFRSAVERLEGVDEFVPVKLWNLRQRRPRAAHWKDALYLRESLRTTHDKLVDLFCPAYIYEMTCDLPVEKDRAEVFCEQAGIVLEPGEDIRPRWVIRPEDTESVRADLPQGRAIGVAIRATDPARTYSNQQTIWMVEALQEFGFEVYVIDTEDRIPGLGDRQIVGRRIEEVAALLPHLVCVVAVCSGILHLAGALDVPCVGLFGPTDPTVMCKHYPNHTTVVAEGYREKTDSPCANPCWFRPALGWNAGLCRPVGCYWINQIQPNTVVEEVLRRVGETTDS